MKKKNKKGDTQRGRPQKTNAELQEKYNAVHAELASIRATQWKNRSDKQLRREHYLANYIIRLEKRMQTGSWEE